MMNDKDTTFETFTVAEPDGSTSVCMHPFDVVGRQYGGPYPVMDALAARQAAINGHQDQLREFTTKTLGRWSGWTSAVSSGLLENWVTTFESGDPHPASMYLLERAIKEARKNEKPLAMSRINHSLVRTLDEPLADGQTVYDLIAGSPSAEDVALGYEPDDPRIAALLRDLEPDEKHLLLALAHPGVPTWADAARFAGLPTPETAGEKVRRKVKRLAAKHRQLWLPGS
ncbi:hypothetical protein [Streptomyces pseudovenezuelae]|uniref:hypothetical protein n=1 Tax=Streptomyces pseudovenezuelae TaxID=67350 RepID=UPI00371F32F5